MEDLVTKNFFIIKNAMQIPCSLLKIKLKHTVGPTETNVLENFYGRKYLGIRLPLYYL